MNETISARSIVQIHGRELSRISDALRTPLTSIVGFAEALLSDPAMETERRHEFTRIIKTEGERLSKFVEELLYLSFSDPDSSGREEAEFDVTTLIDTAIQVVGSRSDGATVRFLNRNQRTPFPVRSDRQFLLVILTNILNNSLKFLAKDQAIAVEANYLGSKLHILVTAHRREAHPSPVDSFGLARTEYLVALRGGRLRTEILETGETATEVVLPVSLPREAMH